MKQKFWQKLTAPQITILGFISIIFAGAFLLYLPISNTNESLTFLNALFTSTSATCVTGLIVVDTGTQFTGFGQFIILLLIQIGGYGIMTLSTYMIFMFGRKLSIKMNEGISESFLKLHHYDLKDLLKSSLILVSGIEIVIACLLFIQFSQDFPTEKAIWYSVFHSVSAFCNAGFSLFPDSMMSYADNILVNITLVIAIIAGGIGFFVIIDLINTVMRDKNPAKRRISFHSKLVLSVSASLIIIGAVLFFLIEYKHNLSGLNLYQSTIRSLFQSVTTRTAGFNSIDFQQLSNASLFLFILLMFIGGAPGSMAGGIKVTSVGILAVVVISKIRGHNQITLFGRAVSRENLERALSVILLSSALIILFVLILLLTELGGLSHTESRGMFLEIIFEAVSAFGTVGLSTGITSSLSSAGRVMIILLMIIGRLGPLTVVFAMNNKSDRSGISYPEEKIMIG